MHTAIFPKCVAYKLHCRYIIILSYINKFPIFVLFFNPKFSKNISFGQINIICSRMNFEMKRGDIYRVECE
ncbi:unnamed protein product [Meloidogyne enterolobii]|uniref:Uncharacterized protein n=1 Tax=Meloidogyne enterolobii TaxID=390850 RepID=A0ACB0Y5Y7_MELEN